MASNLDDKSEVCNPLLRMDGPAFKARLDAFAAHDPAFHDAARKLRSLLATGATLATAYRRHGRTPGTPITTIILELARLEASDLLEQDVRVRETLSPLEWLQHRIRTAPAWLRLPFATRFCLNCGTKMRRQKFCSDKCGNRERARRRAPHKRKTRRRR